LLIILFQKLILIKLKLSSALCQTRFISFKYTSYSTKSLTPPDPQSYPHFNILFRPIQHKYPVSSFKMVYSQGIHKKTRLQSAAGHLKVSFLPGCYGIKYSEVLSINLT